MQQPPPGYVYDPNMNAYVMPAAPMPAQPMSDMSIPMHTMAMPQGIPPRQGATCRICGYNDGQEDIIRPCNCTGAATYVHRGCLNRWRTISPFPDALYKCEFCNTPFSLIYLKKKDKCKTRTRAVAIFASSFLGILAFMIAMWMLCGFVVEKIIV